MRMCMSVYFLNSSCIIQNLCRYIFININVYTAVIFSCRNCVLPCKKKKKEISCIRRSCKYEDRRTVHENYVVSHSLEQYFIFCFIFILIIILFYCSLLGEINKELCLVPTTQTKKICHLRFCRY